jgi:hypothetical protein
LEDEGLDWEEDEVSCIDQTQRIVSELIYSMASILTVNNSPTLHIPQGLAMALRRWRISKRCCQVVKYLAKEPSIKVEVKSLPQPACLGCKVAVAEYDPAVMLTIGMALEHMLPMLLECHRGVAFCRDPTFGGVDTGHMVPADNAFASDTTGIVG